MLQRITGLSHRQITILSLAAAIAILMTAAVMRFHRLGAQSLWHDEGNSYVQATRSFSAIAENAARDIHPPGYYWLLALWRVLTGETEFALRALSAFASLLTVAFTYALGRRLAGHIAAMAAALFVALNTFNIYYAQEARMYALLALWAAASMWALCIFVRQYSYRAGTEQGASQEGGLPKADPTPDTAGTPGSVLPLPVDEEGRSRLATTHVSLLRVLKAEKASPVNGGGGRRRRTEGVWYEKKLILLRAAPPFHREPYLLLLAFFNVAGLYTHYAFPFVTLAQAALIIIWIVLSRQVAILAAYIAANLLTLIFFLPWMPTAWKQVTTWPNTGQIIAAPEAISTILAHYAFGITTGTGITTAVAFLLVFGLRQPVSRRDASSQTGNALYRQWSVLLPVMWVVVPTVLFLFFNLFREANLKFLLPAQIGFALWLGRGVAALWSTEVSPQFAILKHIPKVAAAVGTFVVVMTLWDGLNPLYHDPAYQRSDYRGIASTISSQASPDDAIILDAPNQWEVFTYYFDGDVPIYPLPRGLGGDDEATLREVQSIIHEHERIYAVLWGTQERDPNEIVENTLDTEAFEVDDAWYGDVRLVRYAAPNDFEALQEAGQQFGQAITLERFGLSAESIQPGDVLQVQLQWSASERINTRYKVFVQLLNPDGTLAAQRDAEPGGGTLPTTGWTTGSVVIDNHALIVPNDLPPAHYSLIIGLYNLDDPQDRLPVGENTYLTLGQIRVR